MIPHQPRGSCCAAERLEPRTLLAELVVGIGDGAARALEFIDADGTAVRVTIRRGMLALRFTGDGLAQAIEGAQVRVTGTAVALSSAAASGTSGRTSVTLTSSGGDGQVVVGAITADGPLKHFMAPQVVVTGTLTTGGPVRRLQFLRAENATITLGGGARGTSSVKIVEALDTDLTSDAPLRRLDLGAWGGVDGGDMITSPSIAKVHVIGTFSGEVNVSSAGKFLFGDLQSATINVAGSIGHLHGRNAIGLLVNVAGDIASVSFDLLRQSRIYAGVRPLPVDAPAPTSNSDFVANSTIGRLALRFVDASDNSVVAARVIRSASLRSVNLDRPAPITVIAADRIDRIAARTYVLGQPMRNVRLPRLDDEVRQLGSVELRAL